MFASSALIGYALHRFQRELHCQVPVNTPLELDSKEAFTRARLFADNHILLAEGREDEARQLLRQSIDRAPGDLERQMAYQSILIRLKDRTALNNYAHHLTPIMLKSGDQKMCCRWFLQVRTLLADWTPEQPEHRKQLAEYLLSQHHRAVAEELLAAKNPA